MTSAWLSYVPFGLAQDILAHPGASPVGREVRLDVVALFADVSGFTPISEALSKIGKVGAEELTQILNSYFEPMIDLIQSYGGIIGKFGGDAMTVLFPYSASTRADTARRAIQCALDMQANMGRYDAIPTSAGAFGLAMKAGLALGSVFCTSVGDPATRLEYIIAGGVLDRCADAEHHATRGEVVAHNDLLAAAGLVELREPRGDFGCVARLGRPAAPAPLPELGDIPAAALPTFASYIHPSIAQRVQAGQAGFINEHRKVTVLFVSFGGFDYDADPAVGDKLQGYLGRVIQAIQRYDGYLNKVDMGDKGSKYIVLFGAPVAHENDEERAIRCAHDLIELGIPARVGVNTGFVYCGQVGSPARQEYTVMGDPVNLAARLMQAAQPGQILASEATWRHIPEAFVWEQLAPIMVKGKSDPIAVYAARGVTVPPALALREPAYGLPMVGRKAELAQARLRLERAQDGHGQVLGISAEAGMGKSRLNAEIVRMAVGQGFTGYGGACQSYGTGSPYLVWHNIWRGFFAVDPAAPLDAQQRQLAEQLAEIDPHLAQRLPLLGVALNLSLPDNDLTAALDAQQRAELLRSLLLECLRHRARAAEQGAPPLLLVLEDCHWIDPLSQELLEFVGRNLVDLPICLIVLYRPPDREHAPLGWAARFGHVGEIRLAELEPAEAAELIDLKLAQLFDDAADIPPELVERITAKAQGNPFYLEELVNFIRDRGVDPRDTQALERLDLPDSLYSLILSRIDQLAEEEKTTLKLASVIGRVFRASWLWGSYPEVGAPDLVKQHLSVLSRIDLTPLDRPEPELEYLFKHITTQEVAYESLAVATRTLLHDRIGAFIEDAYGDELDRYLDILAFHFGRSQNASKQRVYYRRAGDAARAAYANQAAIDYYQRLLPLIEGAERAAALCDLGQVWQLIGKWPEAEALYREALALAEQAADAGQRAQCQLAIGYLMWCKADYPSALDWLERARAGYELIGDRRGLSQAIGRLGLVYSLQGEHQASLDSFRRQAELATELGDQAGLAEAIGHMGSEYRERGEYALAMECYERELAIVEQLGNRRESLFAIGNIGLIYQFRGDYPSALANLSKVLDLAVEIGDQQTVTIAAINIGELYRAEGEHARALACYQYGLAAAIELDDRMSIVGTVGNIARIYLDQGQHAAALRLFEVAAAIERELNLPYFLVADLYGAALCHRAAGRLDRAQADNDEVLALAEEDPEYELKARLLAIELRVALGQADREAAAGECAALLDARTEEGEQAAIVYQLWRLTGRAEHRDQAAARYHELYARTPSAEYRQRLIELTGEAPTEPPPLPAPPPIVGQRTVGLGALLARVDAAIGTPPPDVAPPANASRAVAG
jgi:class 3 adenylate cyclase/tetratricopeptide (TPR) repeat protein